MMRRRDLIVVCAGAGFAISSVVRAQRPMPVIGFVNSNSPDLFTGGFREGLSDAGWIDGQNVGIEYRWAEGDYDRLPALAADLVARKVDVIATGGGTPAARAAKNATQNIPVVFVGVAFPVEAGLVDSLARPGGNLTGFSIFGGELTPKRLEVLHELVPDVKTIAMLIDSTLRRNAAYFTDAAEAAATQIGIRLLPLEARTHEDFEPAFASLDKLRAGALVVDASPLFISQRDQLIALASRYAVPTSYFEPEFAEAGGLMSYGPRTAGLWRQAGVYVGKILGGAKPADLPVQQPTEFELVINLKTAKALGLTVPQSLLARADEVIE